MIKSYIYKIAFSLFCSLITALTINAQGNRLSFQIYEPKNLSICGLVDSCNIEVYNISSGPVNNITVKINLPPGINYIKNSLVGTGLSEVNVSNLNQPIFGLPNLALAKNSKFKIRLTADCNLLTYLNSNSTPSISVRADYTGNYDVATSIPFAVKVPSVQYGTITNLSYTGDIGTKFTRSITIGNFGKGPLKEIKLIRYNGKDIQTYYVSKGTTVFKGDTVTTTFGTTFFKTIGNNDTFLDQNETITFIDSSVIKGCKSLNTNFELTWGCGGKNCQVTKISGAALISNKTPNLKAIPLPVSPTCYNNNTFKSEIRFVNIGNMTAIAPRFSISSYYAYMFSSFDTLSIRYKIGYKGTLMRPIKDSTTGSYNAGYYGCIGLYPIGLFRIKTPDLKPNDTIYITWNTTSCTPPNCSNASMVVNSWAYYADYKDQCNNLKTIPWSWGKVYDQHYFSGSSFIPTDLVNNQIGEFRTYINSISMLNRSSSASYVVDIVIPKGLNHSKQKSDLYFINSDLTAYWNPDSIVQKGDTIRGYFPHPVPINLVGAELVYYLKADCSKAGSNGFQNLTTIIKYNTDKTCGAKEWLTLNCQTQQLKIHCINNCAGGLKFRNFKIQRISYGQPDDNNDGKPDASGLIDTTKVREERCFVGDTIESIFQGVVKRTSSIISWRNAYLESIVTNGKYIDVVSIQLLVWRRGVTLNTICNQVKSWKTISGNNATFKIDISTDSLLSCVGSGFRYNNDDSVIVKVKYKVNGNIGPTSQNLIFNNRFYTSNVVNPTSSANKFQCDTFSGQMILTGYYFTTCCNDVYQVNSCGTISVNNYYYLGIGGASYGGNNYFPYEYRNFAKIKAIRVYIPAGLKLKKTTFVQYRTSGSNKTTTELKDTLSPLNSNTNPLVFDVSKYYKDSGGMVNLSDDGFHGYFLAQLDPSCEIQTGNNVNLKYDFIFERKGTLKAGYDTITSGYSDQIVYNKPVFTVKPISPTIYAAQDTAEWEVVFTNYSSSFSNTNTWFSADNSGAIKLVQIKDVGGKDSLMPSTNQVYRLGTIPFNTTRKFKIRAIYNSCNKDSLILYVGWNCTNYPQDIATYPCTKERVPLYLEPQNTQYQVSLYDSVRTADLCASTPYTMTIENIGATIGYNTKALLSLPIGMTVESGSCYLKYPHKNSKTSLPNPSLVSGTTYEWNLSTISSQIGNGFKGISDTNKNKIIIYFRVKTSCDYSSGNYIRASASGNIKCGNPISIYPAISNPLNIKGVTRPYYTLLKIESDSIFPCEKASKVKVKIINLGPSKTGTEDKYQIVLLPGMSYLSSLYNGIYNAPNNSLTTIRNINGASEVEFSLRDSIVAGDSMSFELGFNSDSRYLNCGPVDLYSQAAVKQEVTCVSNNTKCKINVVTGNSNIRPLVVKGSINFTKLSSSLNSTVNDSEQLNLKFRINNIGSIVSNSRTLVYKLLFDKDASGTANKGDIEVYRDTFRSGINTLGFVDISKNIKVKAGQSCALFIALDSSSCSCDFTYAKFPVPALNNAGPDKTLCSGDTLVLGQKVVKGYKYLWVPGAEFKSDTLAQPKGLVENTDTIGIVKKYVLTTYRGQCVSKDTVNVFIYKNPELNIQQSDTEVCDGRQVKLKVLARGGTGGLKLKWWPATAVLDSVGLNTISKINSTTKLFGFLTDTKGCKAKDSLKITVHQNPKAMYTFPETCIGLPILLKDSSTIIGDTISYRKWTFEGIDTLNIKQWLVDLNGNVDGNAQLVIISSFGCADTMSSIVSLNPYPVADYNFKNACFGDSISFKNLSNITSGKIVSNEWQYGDTKTSNTTEEKHLYTIADTFSVKLIVSSDKNCRDTVLKDVVVYEVPKASFTLPNVCLGDSISTINLSSINNDSIQNNVWEIESSIIYGKDIKYLFKKDSTYTLKLVTSTSNGCSDSTYRTVTVYPNPLAKFNVKNVCELDSSFVFDASSIRSGSIVKYDYLLSDGKSYSTKDFNHLFKTGDTFDIEQIVESNFGCKDTFKNSTIVYSKILADFKVQDVCMYDSISILDNSQFINTSIDKWVYIFNNIDSSFVANPSYKFSKEGTYTIKQIVYSKEQCVYDTFKNVIIYPIPKADFIDSNKCVDNQFNFYSKSTISTGSFATYNWDFGDNSSSNNKDPNHVFPGAGNFKVKLKVSSDFGCLDSIEKTVTSYPEVIVKFGKYNVCFGDPIFFTDSSLVPSSSIKKHTWTFGDNTSSTLKDPIHQYKDSGIFLVELNITTAYDCDYDTSSSVQIYSVPVANFVNDPDQGTIVNPEIQFTDMSIGADTIRYDLGDGKFSNMRNLSNSYPDSGSFKIIQYASNTYNCKDTFSKDIKIRYMYVFNTPTAFSPNDDGTNDVYAPGGIGFTEYSMWIFNRWGEMIYETTDGKPWDGKYAGELVMPDVYAVTYKVRDYKGRWHYYSATFTLLR